MPAFDPGGPFQSSWLTLPQPAYPPRSVDGPRTDVEDVSSFVYARGFVARARPRSSSA
jgi:hypothetical protein